MHIQKPVLGVALSVGLLLGSGAQAGIISMSDFVFDSLDNAFGTKTLTFGAGDFGGASVVSRVTLTVDFSKCGVSVNATGCFGGSGTPFANEIGFGLRSPSGTTVSLVENDSDNEDFEPGNFETYDLGSENLSRIVITFDDTGAALGSLPASGVFAPEGALSDFMGESGIGDWTFFYEDDVPLDPLGIHEVTLTLETVPEPSTLALFGLALVMAAVGHRRRAHR